MIAKSDNAINTYKPLIPGAYIFSPTDYLLC